MKSFFQKSFSSCTQFFKNPTSEKWAHRFLVFLFAFLPFNVIIATLFTYKFQVPGIAFLKEWVLAGLFVILAYLYYKKKSWPKFDTLDKVAIGYLGILLLVSLFRGSGILAIIYGARYDFEFIFAFLVAKHIGEFLPEKLSYYFRIALISSSWALICGILVRFVFGENILLHFGFSGDLSNWKFGGSVPIYHGIDGANVRRFQGIFDGPNPAAFFVLVYFGLMVHQMRAKKDLHFLLSIWGCVLLVVLFYTYSRSSILGFLGGVSFLLITQAKTIWKKYRKILYWIVPIVIGLASIFYFKFETTFDRIVLREGSSKGHYDRAITGLKRFAEQPLGSGLAEAGPAYRFIEHTAKNKGLYDKENKQLEDYYIPESWYIQQLVEGGIFGTLAFLVLMFMIFLQTWKRSVFLAASFVGVGIMNLFLHTFESIFISLFFFLILGLLLSKKGKSLENHFFS